MVRSATEALLAGFVRLYWPDQGCGRINGKADRGGYDEVRIVCDATAPSGFAVTDDDVLRYDRLHNGRTVQVPGHEIAPIVSAWLAELGAQSPLVEDLARAACVGELGASLRRRRPITG